MPVLARQMAAAKVSDVKGKVFHRFREACATELKIRDLEGTVPHGRRDRAARPLQRADDERELHREETAAAQGPAALRRVAVAALRNEGRSGGMKAAAFIKILGPARNLRRVREQAAEVEDVQGLFGFKGPAHTISITFRLMETRRRIRVTLNRPALEELIDRMATASVFFLDRPLQEKEPPQKPRCRRPRGKPQAQPPLFED